MPSPLPSMNTDNLLLTFCLYHCSNTLTLHVLVTCTPMLFSIGSVKLTFVHDSRFRLHHCLRRGWLKFGLEPSLLQHQSPAPSSNVSNNSPHFSLIGTTLQPLCQDDRGSIMSLVRSVPDDSTLQRVCRWKEIYIRAHTLHENWMQGRYIVQTPLRGHRERVSCFDCSGSKATVLCAVCVDML